MPEGVVITRSAEETIAFGSELAAKLSPPVLVALTGELGAGKTTLAKGVINGLGAGAVEEVTSPSFTLVHVFQLPGAHPPRRVYHVDLYRVGDFHDLETLGLEDVFAEPAIVLVEWPERLSLRTDWPVLRVHLTHLPDETRQIEIAGGDSTSWRKFVGAGPGVRPE